MNSSVIYNINIHARAGKHQGTHPSVPGSSGRCPILSTLPPCLTASPLRSGSHSRSSSSTGAVTVHAVTTSIEGEIVEVAALKGIRVLKDEAERPRVEYLVEWKDGSSDTWEPATNLADDLLRDYEQRWWTAVKKADEATLYDMMSGGGPVLARTVDDARRSALHFAAGLGRAELVKRLLSEGAEVDLADKDGYTPLHMASGYLHTPVILALLEGGADPEQQDRQGRSPLELVESLREALPINNPSAVPRRVALEEVLKVLTDNLFEDVEPVAVLDSRFPEAEKDGVVKEKEYLVKFADEEEPQWVASKYVSQEVVEDYESGLEYAQAEGIMDVRNRGDTRTYLVRWQDGYPDSWEPEENVSSDLIKNFEEERVGHENGSPFPGSQGVM